MSLRDLIFSQSSQQQHSIPATTSSINNNVNSYNTTTPTVIPTAASFGGVSLSNKTNVTKAKNSRRQQITKTSAIKPPPLSAPSKSSSKVHDVKVSKYSTSYSENSDGDAVDDTVDDDNDDTVDDDDDNDDGNFEDKSGDHQNDNIYESGERNLNLDVPKKR
jgi:hypothetical protein